MRGVAIASSGRAKFKTLHQQDKLPVASEIHHPRILIHSLEGDTNFCSEGSLKLLLFLVFALGCELGGGCWRFGKHSAIGVLVLPLLCDAHDYVAFVAENIAVS